MLSRAGVCLGLGIALAGPGWKQGTAERRRLFVLDASSSFRERRPALRRALPDLLEGVDRWSLLSFAHRPSVELDWDDYGPGAWPLLFQPPGGDGSRLLPALRQARSMLEEGGDVVLATDSQAISSEVLQEASALAAAGHPVHLFCPQLTDPQAAIIGLRAPELLASGEVFALEASLAARHGDDLWLELLSAGQAVANETVHVSASGWAVTRFELQAPSLGPALYRLILRGRGGRLDAADLAVAIDPGEQVLWVGDGALPLSMPVLHLRPQQIRSGEVGWAAAPWVVLDDVAAAQVGDAALQTLADAVRGGSGLVVLGGEQSFGGEGLVGSPLEQLLPMHLSPGPEDGPRSAVVFLVDTSASMGFEEKLLRVRDALFPLRILTDQDRMALLLFDESYRELLPLAVPPSVPPQLGEARGRTHVFPALFRAFSMLEGSPAQVRHIVTLTDGRTRCEPADTLELKAWRARLPEISASFVSVGAHTQTGLLRRLAQLAGGRFQQLQDVEEDLRLALEEETRRVLSAGIQRGTFPVADNAPWVPGPWPAIAAYARTRLRQGAHLGLSVAGDPLLAVADAGRGRVCMFASGLAEEWAPGYHAGAAGPRLVEASLEAVRPRPGSGGWRFLARRGAGGARLEARQLEPVPGVAERLSVSWEGGGAACEPVGLGHYQLELPELPEKIQVVEWHDAQGRRLGISPMREDWPRERAAAWTNDPSLLTSLAEHGGGVLIDTTPPPRPPNSERSSDASSLFVLIGLGCWLLDLGRRGA